MQPCKIGACFSIIGAELRKLQSDPHPVPSTTGAINNIVRALIRIGAQVHGSTFSSSVHDDYINEIDK